MARQAARTCSPNLSVIHQDARISIKFQGHVVMLDILHDINEDDQRRLLNTVATSLPPGGIAGPLANARGIQATVSS